MKGRFKIRRAVVASTTTSAATRTIITTTAATTLATPTAALNLGNDIIIVSRFRIPACTKIASDFIDLTNSQL